MVLVGLILFHLTRDFNGFNFNLYVLNYSCNTLDEGISKCMIKPLTSCAKFSHKAPLAGETRSLHSAGLTCSPK